MKKSKKSTKKRARVNTYVFNENLLRTVATCCHFPYLPLLMTRSECKKQIANSLLSSENVSNDNADNDVKCRKIVNVTFSRSFNFNKWPENKWELSINICLDIK